MVVINKASRVVPCLMANFRVNFGYESAAEIYHRHNCELAERNKK